MESSGGTDTSGDERRRPRYKPNPLSLLSRRVMMASASLLHAPSSPSGAETSGETGNEHPRFKLNPLSLLSRQVILASASLLHAPSSPTPMSPFLLPPAQLPLLPPASPASPASSQPSPRTPRLREGSQQTDESKPPRSEGEEAGVPKTGRDETGRDETDLGRRLVSAGLRANLESRWFLEAPETWLETWADPIVASWKEEHVGSEMAGEKVVDDSRKTIAAAAARLDKEKQLQTRMRTEAERARLAVEGRSEALKRGALSLQRDVEAQGKALKRGVVSLLAQRDMEERVEGVRRGAVSLQRDVQGRSEAVKRGMASLLEEDVEAQSEALKRGVLSLQRDVQANVLAFRRGAEFWRRAVHLYGSYKLCQLQVAVSGQSEEEKAATWQRQHEKGADILYALCTDMKGFFLKAGQFLAKPDLSPLPWVAKLSSLHDSAPADPFPLVLRTIEAELGGAAWRDVWEWVEEQPLGSASIAQVHRGRLRGGKEVAIKVQHAGSKPLMLMDLANLKAFAAFLQRTELNMDVMGALTELEKQIRYEFDFRREAAAMDTIQVSLAGSAASGTEAASQRQRTKKRWNLLARPAPAAASPSPVVVPRSVPGLVTKRLLVMDLIKGVPIMQMEEEMHKRGVDTKGFFAMRAKRSIFRSLGAAYGLMILRDGHFQADPHPGNILICPDKKVALLDYGQTKRLPHTLRLNLARLILAVADKDMQRVGTLFKAVGIRTTLTAFEDPKSFHRMSSLMFDTAASEGVTTSNPFSSESTLKRNGVEKFPEDLFFVVRTMQLLRGLAMGMGLNESLAEQWRSIAKQVIKEAGES
ncbi:hypothetical protein CLOM_g211 [Closterium sp. NIES-68]|nr:hypothetical protein CLOM_g211 [Closterium sp. NIES-68]GJP68030.1 hypothetical protein CLOP_g24787 [Closterium sp. NIES-67]